MKKEDIRGTAYAPITAIEDVTAEMLGYIRERMRLTPSQVQLLEPVVRRAVHQIARKMEFQPLIYGKELTRALGLKGPDWVREWIERELGPGWIYSAGGSGDQTMTLLCRASFFALLDEWKAKNRAGIAKNTMSRLAKTRRTPKKGE